MSIAHGFKILLVAPVLLISLSVSPQQIARADEDTEARDREIRELVAIAKNTTFYNLSRPGKGREAIARLHELSEHAAPAVQQMLAEGLANRKTGWHWVYRPLHILEGMGDHSKVALSDVTKSLDDDHPLIINAAARILERIGPPAKNALPSLQRNWENPRGFTEAGKVSSKKAMANAIKRIDPMTADKLGIE